MKIPIRNLFYLLCYAWDTLDIAEDVEIGTVEAADLENLFARVLAAQVERLVRRGLDRDYQDYCEDSKYIRGRVDFHETAKRLLLLRGELRIETAELSSDTLVNQILKTSIGRLLQFRTLSKQNREELAGLHHAMRDITNLAIASGHFHRVRIHLNNRSYLLALAICEMLHAYSLPDESGGGMRFVTFTRKRMWAVFQRFVTNFYRRRQKLFKVNPDTFAWFRSSPLHSDNVYLPQLQTDLVLSSADLKIVIDTKYMSSVFEVSHARTIVWPTHVNQIFAYMQNISALDVKRRPIRGVLLYAATERAFCLDWKLFGSDFTTAAIDLAQEWPLIERSLLSILAPANILSAGLAFASQ